MIDLETRLLEIHDWDEEALVSIFEQASVFLSSCNLRDIGSIEKGLVQHLHGSTTEEGARIVFRILDQNIRREMRIIEE